MLRNRIEFKKFEDYKSVNMDDNVSFEFFKLNKKLNGIHRNLPCLYWLSWFLNSFDWEFL